jgi:membrane-associated protease RseP (regulator of RpoE activity)
MGGTSSRRGDDRVHLGVGIGAGSSSATGGGTTSGGSAPNAGKGNGYGRGVPAFFGDTIEIINGSPVVHSSGSSPAIGRFGFAVECAPSCSLNRSPSGDYYYKYDGYPRIVEVRERSAADRAGLRVGDLITKVEGKSILNEDPLRGSEQGNQLHITVRRDGKDIDVSMLVVP